MRKGLSLAVAALIFFGGPAMAVEKADTACVVADTVAVPAPTEQSVGLVLSGGGAKGIAEIGAIQALEDNDIPIDYIAGTSMGAIVGGLYACGYTPAEMMEMIASKGFGYWSTGTIDPSLTYYFLRQPQTPAFARLNVNLSRTDSADTTPGILPASLISPLPMNFAFMDLFAAYTAQCSSDFNKLFVPFRCVTSDITAKKKIVCRSGQLSDAIRASMSFPCVFAPIKMNGVYVYDGGLYDNFPVDVMREDFAPDIMIGVDVHASDKGPQPHNIITTIENMAQVKQDYSLPADEGVHVRVDVSEFSLLDWGKAKELYEIGYRRTMEMMDSIKSRVTSREPAETRRLRRAVFKSASPYVRFDSVHVTGGTRAQNEYLSHLFNPEKTDTFGITRARMAYYRALTPGQLRNLMPQADYNSRNGLFTLNLDADVKNNFSVGAGGYLSSSSSSFIFLSADYSSMSFRSTDARLMGWIGQNYMAAEFDGRLYMTSTHPSAFHLEGVYSRHKFYESDKLFYQDNSPAFITTYNAFGRLYYGWALGSKGKIQIGVGGGQERHNFYTSDRGDFSSSDKVRTYVNLAQALLRLEYNTLDNQSYPSAGYRVKTTVIGSLGKYHYRELTGLNSGMTYDDDTRWIQGELLADYYMHLADNFSLGLGTDVMLSTRGLLNTYYASLVNAPAYAPTPATINVFNKRFRANSFIAAGVTPIWMPIKNGQVRLTANVFLPVRRIEQTSSTDITPRWGGWFSNPEFVGQLDLVYNLPFASVCGYVNYLSYPARNWNVGLSFGLYFTAGKLLR